MNHTVQFRIRATEDQLQLMSAQCGMSEQLFAHSLAEALKNSAGDDERTRWLICEWFRTVRFMAQGNFLASGIRVLPQRDVLGDLNRFLQETYNVTPTTEQMAALRQIIEGPA